jgi:ElaB/YqjD/DUF883 family membrane-anchored ribosome-binding protein
MTRQSGQGYERRNSGLGDQLADNARAAGEKARDMGSDALDRADEWLKPTGLSIKERPMTCLGIVAGVAFVAGAFWVMRNSREQSPFDDLLNQVADVGRRAGWR